MTYGCSLHHLRLQEGRPFSEVVLTAKGLGFTEPDPRDDLGGEIGLGLGLGSGLRLGFTGAHAPVGEAAEEHLDLGQPHLQP